MHASLVSVPTVLSIVRQHTGPIETTLCDYETVESINNVLYDQLHELVQRPFFKYFRVRQSTRSRAELIRPTH